MSNIFVSLVEYLCAGCFCCKVGIEGDDGSIDDDVEDDELEDSKEEVDDGEFVHDDEWCFSIFSDDDGSCEDEVEDDVEELEDMCKISDGDDNECVCCEMLFFVDIFDINFDDVIENDKEELEGLGLIFDLLRLFTFSSGDEVKDDVEESED